MHELNALGILLRDLPPRFPSQGVEHQATAHADLAVNAPYRQFDASCLRRFPPGQHMLVDAVAKVPSRSKRNANESESRVFAIVSPNLSV
jgi:hypothetical protein